MSEEIKDIPFDFSQHIQDSLLILSIFDKDVLHYLLTYTSPNNFLSENSKIVCQLIFDYYKKYKTTPQEHFGDILTEKLNSLPENKVKILIEYVKKIYEIHPNKEYVLNNLTKFIRHTNIIKGILEGSQEVEKGNYDKAEYIIKNAFKIGVNLDDSKIDYLKDLNKRATEPEILFQTQIDALDNILKGFSSKELNVWLAPTNVGKSWALIHCAKAGLLQRLKILYYTLEMSPEWVATRIDMSIMGMGTNETTIVLPHFPNETYKVESIFNNIDKLQEKLLFLKSLGGRLIINKSPQGGLSVSKLENELDILELTEDFIPDIILIDYADLMRHETSYRELRHNIADTYTKLRQLAVERNICIITASQSNRASIGAKMVTLSHFAEDIQKAMISDVVLSICQTPEEKEINKMRIFCCKNRNWVTGFQIENWYSYIIGQFSLYSRIYSPNDEDNKKSLDKEEKNVLEYNNRYKGRINLYRQKEIF